MNGAGVGQGGTQPSRAPQAVRKAQQPAALLGVLLTLAQVGTGQAARRSASEGGPSQPMGAGRDGVSRQPLLTTLL